jgi:hypothetical protein
MQFQTQSQFKTMPKSIGLTSTIGDSSKVAILTFGDTEKKPIYNCYAGFKVVSSSHVVIQAIKNKRNI